MSDNVEKRFETDKHTYKERSGNAVRCLQFETHYAVRDILSCPTFLRPADRKAETKQQCPSVQACTVSLTRTVNHFWAQYTLDYVQTIQSQRSTVSSRLG